MNFFFFLVIGSPVFLWALVGLLIGRLVCLSVVYRVQHLRGERFERHDLRMLLIAAHPNHPVLSSQRLKTAPRNAAAMMLASATPSATSQCHFFCWLT